jgi:RecA-family ATPase
MIPAKRGMPAEDGAEDLLAGIHNGEWLDNAHFAPLLYALPGIVPEGLAVLAGAPKVGKSWLVLEWLLAIASSGGRAMDGIRIKKARPVFYLALEDGDRRMKDRSRKLLGVGQPTPPLFAYKTKIKDPGKLLPTIAAWLSANQTGLVVVDTLGKAMPPCLTGETTYSRDYRVMAELKDIVDKYPGAAIVVNHHDRKAAAGDFVEAVSGTNGIAGGADTVIVLRRKRGRPDGLIQVTGRDVLEGAYALQFEGGRWVLEGGSLEAAAAAAEMRRAGMGVGDRSRDIIACVARYPAGVRAPQVAKELGMSDDQASVTTALCRLVESGRLARPARGIYTPTTPR